ncbi:EF-hand calcium-binding domain-containing protein 7 isoform X1 [Cricetulus griseus]|uniref:EF-hand calcium-binding domain-containing protein 7 n=1 Tax=Cricetulus griseus TaxID=10029 RepID=A0A9J7GTB7_CRIGR|nr:EF-hand calcium-binding domain-containing protein 7 isoform X1 [Cricetulus griseus]XP_035295670.1 EF-hand calcium-binding domain-containing protein 7 isoform X1 [Cricetulus griseus]XP_035295671.1 EF-hand calcium-binding domain-containing protein 7 isoform X1 [Cricetulus griseus]XP_035295672.1 EF-hand calcium-binding domain-containing protein 7 isoform X1 [Cricetulus griseus]XP_035295673.1 EF-hand calcium-binding domain-containing protein 7 isoform X1 [Cricetulus griseus]XP_035297794.1 EF-ha
MASNPGSDAALGTQISMHLGSPRVKKLSLTEQEVFYMNCRAAYLTIFKSSLENIISKDQLYLAHNIWSDISIPSRHRRTTALQHAGRNPSQKTINKYWTPQTAKLNFDDFCIILSKEEPTSKAELLKSFKQLDVNDDGSILHSDLYKYLTKRGEKMTQEEVNAVINLADVNADGKFDYIKFCELYMTTSEQCLKTTLERLEADRKLRRQQFGSHMEGSPERDQSPAPKQSPRIIRKDDQETFANKGDTSHSLLSTTRKFKTSVSFTITMSANSNQDSKLTEPNLKDWQCAQSKGCFFLEEDGEVISHQYKMHIPQRSVLYLTIKPLNLSQIEGKCSPWLSVDTALYILKENEDQAEPQLMCFTELQNREVFGWTGELGPGIYWLIPSTTGCRLRKEIKPVTEEAQLVYRDETGELFLTSEFRSTLSEIFEVIDLDGNGLISLEEYNFFELRTSGEKCDEDAWAVCRENFDTKKNELTKQGFMDLHLMEANDREGDPLDLWVTLHSMGYNKALQLTEACPFIINIYAEKCKPKIKAVHMEACSGQLERAICKSVLDRSDAKVMDGYENIIVHTCNYDTWITSIIENKTYNFLQSDDKVIIHINNELSKNCVNNRGLNIFAVEVAPRSTMVCQHVMPLNEQQEWIYYCVYSLIS